MTFLSESLTVMILKRGTQFEDNESWIFADVIFVALGQHLSTVNPSNCHRGQQSRQFPQFQIVIVGVYKHDQQRCTHTVLQVGQRCLITKLKELSHELR